MKKFLILACLILSLSGCATIRSGISDFNSAIGGMGRPVVVEPAPRPVFTPSIGMSPSLQFSVFYSSYFFLGGYGFGDDNFKEGQGITWTIQGSDSDGEFEVTRALLKTLDDGSQWWLLLAKSDGEENSYEMLLDGNGTVLKFRYLNPDTGKPAEYVPKQGESSGQTGETMTPDSYRDYVRNEESVKTRAGSFKTQHLVFEGKDEENQVQFRYEYWISDSVPGRCVKYRYENTGEKDYFGGEVSDVRGGYKTRLDSY